MLNVLTLSTLYPNSAQPNFGGFVERQTARLAARSDVDLRVVAPVGRFMLPLGPYAAERGIPARDMRSHVPVSYPRFPLFPAIGWRMNPAFVERAARGVIDALAADGFRPDVIDCEFFWPDGPAAVRLGADKGIPVSIKARGSDVRLWGKRPAARRMMVDAARRAEGLLAVSDSLKAEMVAIGMPADKIIVHRTGIELVTFNPENRTGAKARLGIDGTVLLAVGNLVPLKRQHLIVEAAALLPAVTLFIAGDGPERPRLQSLIAVRGLSDRVRLLGNVPHAEMPMLMAAADVFVHAASSEGLANVWVEALASGTPVVSTRVGGAAEVVDRPAAGRLIDNPTATDLARAISAVLADPPSPEAVRESALRFDWNRNTETLFKYLSGLKR